MAKFEIEVEITGFKLKIKGEKEALPSLTKSIGRQLSGMLSVPDGLVEDADVVDSKPLALQEASPKKVKKARAKPKINGSPKAVDSAAAIELNVRQIQEKYGTPIQSWSGPDKAIWLLYVVQQELGQDSLTSAQIRETSAKYFKAQGPMSTQAVADLRRKLTGKLPLLGQDNNQDPAAWYLTDAGKKHAETLVANLSKD
jgi:hypothetical protein